MPRRIGRSLYGSCGEAEHAPPQQEEGKPILLPFPFSGHTRSSEGKARRTATVSDRAVGAKPHRPSGSDSMGLVDGLRAARCPPGFVSWRTLENQPRRLSRWPSSRVLGRPLPSCHSRQKDRARFRLGGTSLGLAVPPMLRETRHIDSQESWNPPFEWSR